MDDLKYSFQDRRYLAEPGYKNDILPHPFVGHATVGSSFDNKISNPHEGRKNTKQVIKQRQTMGY